VQPSQIPNTSKTAQTPQKPVLLPAAVTQPAPSPETTDKPETLRRVWKKSSVSKIDGSRPALSEGQFAVAEKLYREVKAPLQRKQTRQLPEPFLTLPSYPQQVRCTGVKQKPVEHLRYKPESWYRCGCWSSSILNLSRTSATGSGTASIRSPQRSLERATTLYPAQPDLVKAKVAALADAKNGWKHLRRVNF